jgi:hypothetical protein
MPIYATNTDNYNLQIPPLSTTNPWTCKQNAPFMKQKNMIPGQMED